jgi:hypothetical protein
LIVKEAINKQVNQASQVKQQNNCWAKHSNSTIYHGIPSHFARICRAGEVGGKAKEAGKGDKQGRQGPARRQAREAGKGGRQGMQAREAGRRQPSEASRCGEKGW